MPSLASYIPENNLDNLKDRSGTIGRFTKIFGNDATKVLGNNHITAKVKTLMVSICDEIRASKYLVGTLTFKNVNSLAIKLKDTYENPDLILAMQEVVNTYPNIDKRMQIVFKNNEIHFRRIV